MNLKNPIIMLARVAKTDPRFVAALRQFLFDDMPHRAPVAMGVALHGNATIASALKANLAETPAPALALELVRMTPPDSVAFADFLLVALPQAAKACTDTQDADVFRRRYVTALARTGHHKEALEIERQLAGKRQDLPADVHVSIFGGLRPEILKNPAEFERRTGRQLILKLATPQRGRVRSTTSHVHRLMDQGNLADALRLAHEAVSLARKIEPFQHGIHDDTLPRALSALARCYDEGSDASQAIRLLDEARALWKSRVSTDNHVHTAEMARLDNMAAKILAPIWPAEALRLARMATEGYRKVARDRPDSYNPDLALSLNTEAGCLRNCKRSVEAYEVAQKSVEIYRKLGDWNRPESAMAHNTVAGCLVATKQFDEARLVCEEAIELLHDESRDATPQRGHLVKIVLTNYALILRAQHERGQEITLPQPGPSTERLAVSLHVAVHRNLVADVDREVLLRRAIALAEHQADAELVVAGRGLLAVYLRETGKIEGALRLLIAALVFPEAARTAFIGKLRQEISLLAAAVDSRTLRKAWVDEANGEPDCEMLMWVSLQRDVRVQLVPELTIARPVAAYLQQRGFAELAAVTECEASLVDTGQLPSNSHQDLEIRKLASTILACARDVLCCLKQNSEFPPTRAASSWKRLRSFPGITDHYLDNIAELAAKAPLGSDSIQREL